MTVVSDQKLVNGDASSRKKSMYDGLLPADIGTDNSKKIIVWKNVIGFIFLHLAGLYGVYCSFYAHFATTVYATVLSLLSAIGVTAGAHRLYSHKAYKAKFLMKLFVIVLQTVAGQNCLYIWVRDHRLHHKYSDTDADPHNSNRGFFFSHMGWLMCRKHPAVIAKGKTIDLSDLKEDSLVMLQKEHYKLLYAIFAIIIPVAIPIYLWNETLINSFFLSYILRYLIALHGTWSINSAAHMFGSKPYDQTINPVEMDGVISWFTIGEGWHNYHHTFPWDYRAAELGIRYSLTTITIDIFAYFGQAYDLRDAKSGMVKEIAVKRGDGSHKFYGKWGNRQMEKKLAQKAALFDDNNNEMCNKIDPESKKTAKLCTF